MRLATHGPLVLLALINAIAPARAAAYDEADRPQFHYSPPSGLLKDPNGLVYFNGLWHLYFQYIPTNAV